MKFYQIDFYRVAKYSCSLRCLIKWRIQNISDQYWEKECIKTMQDIKFNSLNKGQRNEISRPENMKFSE